MLNIFRQPDAESLRDRLLQNHRRQLIAAELAFEHAKANLEMQRAIILRLSEYSDDPN